MVTDHCYLTALVALNMDENDIDYYYYDVDELNSFFLLMTYDYVVSVQRVHRRMKILHYKNTNDNCMVDYSWMQRVYVERFHIVDNR